MKIPRRNPALFQYELFPRVSCVEVPCVFTARGLGKECALLPGETYRIYIIPQEENISAVTLEISEYRRYPSVDVCASEDGAVRFTLTLGREQIYTLRLVRLSESEPENTLCDFRVFCAGPDLFERTPMRGNTHCHTMFSPDGHEDPYLAAAYYRQAGFDFLAITDHHTADGSLEAIRVSEAIPSGLSLYIGEEVHVPNPYIHAVNIGALTEDGCGLDRYYRNHRAEVNEEVSRIAAESVSFLPSGIEPMDYAWRKWIADTIHRHGGIAVLAHPFWEYEAHNTRDDMFRYLSKEGIYDAAEIVHGQEPGCPDANMQIAFWNEMRADGIFITPVGADDAHRRVFDWNYDSSFNEAYTILFAKDPSFDGFAEAIRGGYSAAVESYEGAPEHVISTYRLTKYTLFLLDQYFPEHDALCFEEGRLMRSTYLDGGSKNREGQKHISERIGKYAAHYFGRITTT